MNRGSRIILILGIVAAVVFALSLAHSLKRHYDLRVFHQNEFARIQRIAAPGSAWADAEKKLKISGFQIQASGEPAAPGGERDFFCRWNVPADFNTIQTERLGVPTAARIGVSPDGKISAVTGL